MTYRPFLLLALAASLALVSCRTEERLPTREQLFERTIAVDTLYLTEDGREIIAPGNREGAIVDPKTGKLAWAALTCGNPKCPGEGKNGRPYVFAWPHPFVVANPDGTLGMRQPESQSDFDLFDAYAETTCPACLTIRDRANESPQVRQKHKDWIRPYVLPQAEAQLKEIEEKYKEYLGKVKEATGRN
jgi:hypothetical protein